MVKRQVPWLATVCVLLQTEGGTFSELPSSVLSAMAAQWHKLEGKPEVMPRAGDD